MSTHTRIKICCISDIGEAHLAIAAGAHAIGLVGPMPSGPGVIPDDLIPVIAAQVPPSVSTFLLTSETKPDRIIAHCRLARTTTVQIVDRPDPGSYRQIREALPHLKIVQVIHVAGRDSVEEACEVSPQVDALLLDSGNPRLDVKVLGGTGKVHDWSLSREIRDRCGKPVFLAGGLNPGNVGEAVRLVKPFGVDVCTGVRTSGRLDPAKLSDFIGQAWNHK